MKKNIKEDTESFFDSKELYKELGVPWKRGIIFHGIPGNGKTASIKALIRTLYDRDDQIPSLYVKSLATPCGGLENSIRSIFQRARAVAPCFLILEDLDSLISDEVRSYFLNEVDGLESNDGILILGSTNHLDKLDPAISKRPSRFDRKYHFKLPNEEERIAYSEFWRKKLQKSRRVEFPEEISPIIAKLTEGFSFAYIKELFVMSLLIIAHGTTDNTVDEKELAIENLPEDAELSDEQDKLRQKIEAHSSIEIPEAFQNNQLLKVLKKQSGILLLEMDNTDVKNWKSGSLSSGGSGQRGRMPGSVPGPVGIATRKALARMNFGP